MTIQNQHNKVLTYNLDNQEDKISGFNLKKIELIYDRLNGIEDAPHRHSYYTLILINKADGIHRIDFKEYSIVNKSIHFIYPGQVHQFITNSRPDGWVLNFSPDFLIHNNIFPEIVNGVYLYNSTGDSPPLLLSNDEYSNFAEIMHQINKYYNSNIKYQYEALGSLLKLLFINANSHCSLSSNSMMKEATGTNHILIKFKDKIEDEYNHTHKVYDYAEMLNVTSDYLNKSIKAHTGKSAKEFIQERVLLESKRLLLFSDKTNKELAYYLGFEEPAHFNNFFKKMVGTTPGEFRETARNY